MYVTKSMLTKIINAGCLWKIINRSIPTKERSTQVYSKPTVQIANDFNQYFVSVGKQAANAAAQLAKAGFPLDNFFARSEFFICLWSLNWNHLELIG